MADAHADARVADAAEVAEATCGGDPVRHRELGELWWRELGRVDRAVLHLRRAWDLGRDRAAMDALRAIHASLGEDVTVERLYGDELAAPLDDARAASLLFALGRLHARRGETAAAADALERSLALAPDDEKRALLADVSAGLRDPARAVELCLELAARADGDAAVTWVRRALGLAPGSAEVRAALEETLLRLGRWAELERAWRELGDPALLEKRARLLAGPLDDRAAAKRCWEALGDTAELRALYRQDGDWEPLVALLERADAPVADLLEAADVARGKLQDRERAAGLLRRILAAEPGNAEALSRHAEHFREKRDWRGLADLQARAVASAAPEDKARRLEELAETCEQRLGDVERATAAWRTVLELEPASARGKDALRRLESRAKMWESLIAVLEKEAAGAPGPREKADALKRRAAVYRERQVDPRRAIAIYEEALALTPGDAVTLRALAELHEREGDDAGVARTLRRQLDATASAAKDALPAPQRIERLTLLRRLAALYDGRLADVEGVVWACTAILELHTGDREAMDRLERVLERAGDVRRLEQTLLYRAEAATGPAERARALRRLARLADGRDDLLEAMERWERALRVVPNDTEALEALARLYESAGRWGDLANALERLIIARLPALEPTLRRRYARVVDTKLGDAARASKAWRHLLEAQPRDREALEALARRLAEVGALRELGEVLGRQAALFEAGGDRVAAADVALARAALLDEKLADPAAAAAVLDGIIRELAPGNVAAHERRVRLAVAAGDVERAVRLLERLVWLVPEPAAKIGHLEHIGRLCVERLGDPRRALQAYERLLELDRRNAAGLAAAAALHQQVGQWTQHVATLERLAAEREGAARQDVYLAIAHAVEEELGDAGDGLRWLGKAHRLAPGARTLDALRHAAARHGFWSDLALVLDEERHRDEPRFVELSRELAALREVRLADPLGALATLADAAAVDPTDALLDEGEAIAARAATPEAWRAALDLVATALELRPEAALHARRARIFEEHLGDADAALDERLAAFADDPGDGARGAIVRLAGRTGRWPDVVRIDATLFARETTPTGRVRALARAARLIEDHLDDRPRAFKGWLQAFRIAPDDAEVEKELWRLARLVGSYGTGDETIRLEVQDLLAEAEVEDATIQLDLADLEDAPARATMTHPPPVPHRRRRYPSAWAELAAACEALPPPGGLYRAADVWERGAGDVGRAFDALGRALARAPAEPETRARLDRLAAAHDGWNRLAELLESAAERATSAGEAARLLHDVATLRGERGQEVQAELVYRRILGMRPDDEIARRRLVELHRAAGRWVELAAALEERTEPRVPAAERVAALRELAHIYAERVGHPYEAVEALERLVALVPDDVASHEAIANLYDRLGRSARVAAALAKVVEHGDPARARAARRRIGKVYEEELELPERAIEAYAALAAAWPDDEDALEALDRLYTQTGRTAELTALLRRRAARTSDPQAQHALLARVSPAPNGRAALLHEAAAAARVDGPNRPAALLAIGRRYAAGALDEDGARALLELAAALGAPLTPEDKRYLYAHPARALAPDEPYDGVLEDGHLCADPADGALPDRLARLGPAALPPGDPPDADPLDAGDLVPAVQIFAQVGRVLGAPPARLYAARAAAAPDVTVCALANPAVVIGPRLMAIDEPDPLTDAELRFVLGRAAFLTRPGRLPAALPDAALARLAPGANLAAYRAACARAADRAGLIVCGSVAIGLRLGGHAEHLVRLVADERYLAARARIGIGATR